MVVTKGRIVIIVNSISMIIVHSLDQLKDSGEQLTEDVLALFQLEAHVERLDVGQILQQVKVSLEGSVLGIL